MKRFNHFVICVISFFGPITAYGQDIHFTQFTNIAQHYNPATVGQFEQMMRGTLLHKGNGEVSVQGIQQVALMHNTNY